MTARLLRTSAPASHSRLRHSDAVAAIATIAAGSTEYTRGLRAPQPESAGLALADVSAHVRSPAPAATRATPTTSSAVRCAVSIDQPPRGRCPAPPGPPLRQPFG